MRDGNNWPDHEPVQLPTGRTAWVESGGLAMTEGHLTGPQALCHRVQRVIEPAREQP